MGNDSAGLHLIMDARVEDSAVFTKEHLTRLFASIVEALGMQALGKIQVYEVPVDPAILARVKLTGNFEDEGGISTVQVISTSHLSLHAWPLQKYFALDAFSCKDFDADLAQRIIYESLGVRSANTLVVQRFKPEEGSAQIHVQRYSYPQTISPLPEAKSKRFYLLRDHDHSGISGVGVIAEGVQFSTGACVLSWLTEHASTGNYANLETLMKIHGHNGSTRCVMLD